MLSYILPVKVEQINDQIKITNFPINLFRKDLLSRWSTDKILNIYEMAFHWYGGGSTGYLKFHQFFVPELLYIFTQIPNRKAYREVVKQIHEKTWYKLTTQQHPSRINLSKLSNINATLKPHQRDWLDLYDQRKQQFRLKGYLIAWQQSGGKTLGSIATMECLGKEKIIVVAPNNTLYVTWETEIRKWCKQEQQIWSKKNPNNPEEARWYIVNYESMSLILNLIKDNKLKCNSDKLGIIVDEVHNFRNHETKRSKEILEIANLTKCTDILALSGTPTKALGRELMTLMMLIDPMFNNTEIQEIFRKTFGLDSTKLADIISNRLGLVMHRVLTSEVVEMPEKSEETIKVKVPNSDKYTLKYLEKVIKDFIEERLVYYSKNRSKYESDYKEGLKYFEATKKYDKEGYSEYLKIVKKIVHNDWTTHEEKNLLYKQANTYEKNVIMPVLPMELKKRFKKAKSVYKYTNLVVVGEALGHILPKARADCYKDLITYGPSTKLINEAEKKTIIFTTYNSVVEHGLDFFKQKGLNPVGIYQKTSNTRDVIFNKFRLKSYIIFLLNSVYLHIIFFLMFLILLFRFIYTTLE